jgi:uncharacterized damage-inducible protein DinB
LLKLLDRNKTKISERSVQLINHLIDAHQIWNERLLGEKISCAVWEIREFADLPAFNQQNYDKTMKVLNDIELDKNLAYKTSTGIDFVSSVRDILFQVINHSTHHRAQISADLRNNGIEPINMDYIYFKRG